ncbi:uncharacterized protein LOC111379288 isoform X3 [Olea europaea var. sylvestris]|uniref:uncharacterized protein LOC111379288 isoform X3 n=1 Tax=Olea europaea var. sylvestris TaxID=158386 RepID=UPI000C1CEB0B|nr:uncharacterized protein LOC111379288 isoform X3 [Olea europaea var. sylvestris]
MDGSPEDQVMDEMQEVNDIEVDDWLERELEPVESHYNTSQDKRKGKLNARREKSASSQQTDMEAQSFQPRYLQSEPAATICIQTGNHQPPMMTMNCDEKYVDEWQDTTEAKSAKLRSARAQARCQTKYTKSKRHCHDK